VGDDLCCCIPRASADFVPEDLIKSPVGQFAVKLLCPGVDVLPVVVAPCSDLYLHLLRHGLGLRGVGDYSVHFTCGSLAELQELWGVGFESDAVKEISEGEFGNCLLVHSVAQDF
jgi:hypothetical protein